MIILLWPTTVLSFRLTAWSKTPISENQLLPAPASPKRRFGLRPPCPRIQATFLMKTPARASGTSCEVSSVEAPSRLRKPRALRHRSKTRRIAARHRLLTRQPTHSPPLHLRFRSLLCLRQHRHLPLIEPTISASPWNGLTNASVPTTTCASNLRNFRLQHTTCYNQGASTRNPSSVPLQLELL